MSCQLESVQDFMCELGMKPCTHLVKISIFSLNHVIVRPTKIKNRANKNWEHFLKNKVFSKLNFSKTFFNKSWSPSPIFLKGKLFWKDLTNF